MLIGRSVAPIPRQRVPCYGPLAVPRVRPCADRRRRPPGSAKTATRSRFSPAARCVPISPSPMRSTLFLTSMKPGVTRKQGTSELTLAVKQAQGDSSGSITRLRSLPTARHIAFVTPRDSLRTCPNRSRRQLRARSTASELYVSPSRQDSDGTGCPQQDEGGDLNGSIWRIQRFPPNGSTVGFTSSASNLIFGDANGVSDAFTATLQAPGGTAAPPAGFNAVQGGFTLTGTHLARTRPQRQASG